MILIMKEVYMVTSKWMPFGIMKSYDVIAPFILGSA